MMSKVANLISFFRDGWGELKRVRWPNRKELLSYTVVTTSTVILMSLIIFGFDLGISKLLELIKLGGTS
jgi:preprotein translocase subunit SecE